MSWTTLKDRSKRKWKGSHLYHPWRNEDIKAAMLEPGHFSYMDVLNGSVFPQYVVLRNYSKTELAIEVCFTKPREDKKWQKAHPDMSRDSRLHYKFIVVMPMDEDLAIDTTGE